MEVPSKAEGSLRCYSPAFVHNFTDASGRHVQLERQLIDRQLKRLHEILSEDFTWVDRRQQLFRLTHCLSPLITDSRRFPRQWFDCGRLATNSPRRVLKSVPLGAPL